VNPLILGLAVGIAFGAALVLSGLSSPRRILDMLRLKDLFLLRVIVTALGTGIVGVALLDSAGLAHTTIKTLHVVALVLGGAIFGTGFAITGYCPGTSLAATAEGRRDAPFVVAGGLVGAGVFALLYATLEPFLIAPATYGNPTLPSILRVAAPPVALVAGALVIGLVLWWLRRERERSPRPHLRRRSAG
jgi:uncharacterized membrane protein YedE/YeeE